jgi:hypothetical protein
MNGSFWLTIRSNMTSRTRLPMTNTPNATHTIGPVKKLYRLCIAPPFVLPLTLHRAAGCAAAVSGSFDPGSGFKTRSRIVSQRCPASGTSHLISEIKMGCGPAGGGQASEEVFTRLRRAHKLPFMLHFSDLSRYSPVLPDDGGLVRALNSAPTGGFETKSNQRGLGKVVEGPIL